MAKLHEIRDPIHNFVKLDDQEREVLNSPPCQRLRHIHQLGMSHFVYPGANHTRLEHSLGVMELAGRAFDVLFDPRNLEPLPVESRQALQEALDEDTRRYWRRALRMAALCHDLGHLPFSHAAESELLPHGLCHEMLTQNLIESDLMAPLWKDARPVLNASDIAKLALGPKHYRGNDLNTWEALLSEIIAGDAFGVDRMDYLLRDAHHLGVAYGRFDHYRLIDTLRILPQPPAGSGAGGEAHPPPDRPDDESEAEGEAAEAQPSQEPAIGVEEGGLHAAEGLLLARYFMFSQVYYHHVRRVYDLHLKEFLLKWLPKGRFPTDCEGLLAITDHEVMAALLKADRDPKRHPHEQAQRIVQREHFRRVYSPSPDDLARTIDARDAVFKALAKEFGRDMIRQDHVPPKPGPPDFPVRMDDGRIASAISLSDVIATLPQAKAEYVFAHPSIKEQAEQWLEANRDSILPSERAGQP